MPRDLNALSLDDLFAHLLPSRILRRESARFLSEDLGSGDVTSRATIPPAWRGRARLVAREACTLAGMDAVAFLATSGARDLLFVEHRGDGARVRAGETVAVLEGRVRDMLAVERCVLNLLGRLSGVATQTAAFVAQLGRGRARLYDTRKTTPGLRLLEKFAVRAGGGFLHRLGLSDAMLVKDNHLAALGSLAELRTRLEALGARRRRLAFVEVEVDELRQLAEILAWPAGLVDIVLLDNMPPAMLRRAVRLRDRARSRIELEASGGVNLASIAAIARTGVERISAGSITHSARSIDFGLDMEAGLGGVGTARETPAMGPRAPKARGRSRR